MSNFTVYRDTDVILTFEVRNTAGSLIDLSTATVKMVIGTTAYEFVAVKDGAGQDGTGDTNASVIFTNDDATWDMLTGDTYTYQLNVTDVASKVTIPVEGRLTIKKQIPQA